MKVKAAILCALDRDALKCVVDDLELHGVDRRSVESMRNALTRSRRVTPQVLIEYLDKDELQQVCADLGLPASGRKKELVERVLSEAQPTSDLAKQKAPPRRRRKRTMAKKKRETMPQKTKNKDTTSGSHVSAQAFDRSLEDYLVRLTNLRQRGASEDSIRDVFLQFLRSAFPRLQQAEPIELEKHIPALRVRGGYVDALFGDLIFECKRRLNDASRAEGCEELTRYIRNQQHPERFLGILNDGETLEVYALRNGDLQQVDQITLSAARGDEAKLWLDCYLFHEKNLTPTANDVALRFGDRSPTFWHSLRMLAELWQAVGDDPTVQTKFVEWQSLLSIVYGSAVGEESLFLRHSYLALFARALAFTALQRRAPNADELPGIITGETFDRMGFENFVGDDFFTWVTDPSVFEQAKGLLRSIATRLTGAYDLSAVHEDLLKELYQELVDPQTRHDLGEFYTPDWLAELTLRKSGFPPSKEAQACNASLFDPSCGSGTFLFTAVRLLREAGFRGKRLVELCVDQLAGIDVHPLAVTIAKTNLLLALGDDVRAYEQTVSLPIFLADSLSPGKRKFKPDPERDVIPIPVDTETIAKRVGKTKPPSLCSVFEIPVSLADRPDVLHQCVNTLLEFGRPQIDEKDARQGFQTQLKQLGLPDTQWHRWASNLKLMRWLLQPPVTNSVWRFILDNAYQPELLARRKFAFVVGNPPWLSYRYVQRTDYQGRVRELAFDYGLLQKKQAHLFTQMELATLFFAFCEDRFLAEDGKVGFVMPRSVMTGAKQHDEFRKRYLGAAEFVIDCEQVRPLFNVPACVIICRKLADAPEPSAKLAPVPALHLRGQLPNRNASLSEAQSHLKESENAFSSLTTGGRSPYHTNVVQGASLAPRCAWFVQTPDSARAINRRRPQLETDRSTKRQAKQPWKDIRLTGSVEADFLFATLLSDNMLPFGWRRLSLIVLPVAEKKGTLEMITADEAVRRGKAGLADWLRKAEKVWEKHAKSTDRVATIYQRLDFGQCLSKQHAKRITKVLYNSQGTHVCSCVVDAMDSRYWKVQNLRVRGFISDYVTYWFETQHPDESHYLCAVLNAPLVDEAIKPYQTKGAFGAQTGGGQRHIHRRPFEVLPIPRFDPKNKRHRQLAELSRRCHEQVAQAVAEAHAGPDERFFTTPIGRLRTQMRRELLADELAQIDDLVTAILK